jgi:hypothetical protein
MRPTVGPDERVLRVSRRRWHHGRSVASQFEGGVDTQVCHVVCACAVMGCQWEDGWFLLVLTMDLAPCALFACGVYESFSALSRSARTWYLSVAVQGTRVVAVAASLGSRTLVGEPVLN